MITLATAAMKIYVCAQPTDMRKGLNGSCGYPRLCAVRTRLPSEMLDRGERFGVAWNQESAGLRVELENLFPLDDQFKQGGDRDADSPLRLCHR